MTTPRHLKLPHDAALRAAGVIAIATAIYHGITGDKLIRAIDMSEDDLAFVTGTYQLGTIGWLAGGALLLGAATMPSRQARTWIVGVLAVLYGIPAFGSLALTNGEISPGGVALAAVVVLALYGRIPDAATPSNIPALERPRP